MEWRLAHSIPMGNSAFRRPFLCPTLTKSMKRFSLILISVLLLSHSLLAADKPNFLLILLDDAGWTDVGCYGSQIQTPNIDRLAKEGMRFTDCHSSAPNCSPSRAGLLTGRTPSRAGIYSYLPPNHVMHLRSEEVTVAELLKGAGYHTGHFGKWHLSRLESDQPGPLDQGFDHSLGTDNKASPSHQNPTNFIRNGKPAGEIKGYSCQIVVDETINWLERHQASQADRPFFGCVWFHEPHTPIASPPDMVAKYQKLHPKLNKRDATYYANVDNADRAIGRLLKKLDALGVAKDTLIFFTSDNGPLNRFSNVGLRGKKSNVWEGGHRVPGIFRWPGKIKAGSVSDIPICGVDFLPTVCSIAGVEQPRDRVIDGANLTPILTGKSQTLVRKNPLYWFFYRLNPSLAIRDGDWALVAETTDAKRPKAHALIREDMPHIKSSQPATYQLFNLANDLGQETDLASSHPEKLEALLKKMKRMHEGVVAEGVYWDIPEAYSEGKSKRIWK